MDVHVGGLHGLWDTTGGRAARACVCRLCTQAGSAGHRWDGLCVRGHSGAHRGAGWRGRAASLVHAGWSSVVVHADGLHGLQASWRMLGCVRGQVGSCMRAVHLGGRDRAYDVMQAGR
jgi:hypothetical protein